MSDFVHDMVFIIYGYRQVIGYKQCCLFERTVLKTPKTLNLLIYSMFWQGRISGCGVVAGNVDLPFFESESAFPLVFGAAQKFWLFSLFL